MSSIIKVDEILDGNGNQFDGSQLGNVGKVLQVKQASSGTQYSFSSSSGVCGPSVSITPSSINSKILIFVHTDAVTLESNATYGKFYLRKNGTNLIPYGYPLGWDSADNARGTFGTQYLESPLTTAELTYDTYWQGNSGTVIQINRDGEAHALSTITVMEIGA